MKIIDEFPFLEIDEIKIRLSRTDDARNLVNYFNKNRKYLKPWEPTRTEGFFSLAGWQRRLIQLSELQKHGLSYYFLIFSLDFPDEIIGIITYNSIMQYPAYSANLGYSLDQDFQSKGIMQRALKLTNQWLFNERHIHRITASYMPRNERSAKVLASVGFKIEGRAEDYLLINGQWEDHVLTSLTNINWIEMPELI